MLYIYIDGLPDLENRAMSRAIKAASFAWMSEEGQQGVLEELKSHTAPELPTEPITKDQVLGVAALLGIPTSVES